MRRNLAAYAVLILISVPFWLAGAVWDLRLLPGLPLSALMFVCPLLAAVIVLLASGERVEAKAIARAFFRVGPAEAAASFLAMPLLCLCAYLLDYGPEGLRLLETPAPGTMAALLGIFLVSAFCEEYLWTGYLLRGLAEGNRLRHLFLVPLAYVAWHALPFFQTGHDLPWILGQLAFSFSLRLLILAALRLSGQRAAVAVLIHAGYNLAWQLYPGATASYNPWSLALVTAAAFALAEWLGAPRRARPRAAG